MTDLHARTVPLDYGPDALQFDGSPTVLFDRPGLTLVGWGTALLVGSSEAEKVLASIPCEDGVGRPGSGVVALGALPFDHCMSGDLIIPRFTMGISVDPDGSTHRWATAVGSVDAPLPDTDELFDSVIWQYGSGDEGGDRAIDVHVTALTDELNSNGYRELVDRAVAEMRSPGAALRKVVLSRGIDVALSGSLVLSTVLRGLRAQEPSCTIFSMPTPFGTFFGATPELIVAKRGQHVSSHPLAGTVARGDTARRDADAQGRLAASAKDHEEHRYVVDSVAEVLGPFCSKLRVPSSPSLVAFRSVAHLGTRIDGELNRSVSVLELLERLSPTPAVGGTPRAEALDFIAAGEPSRRGYWAGPVGWVDAAGDGDWMIGIRSAHLHPNADGLTLRAGAGIVVGSQPEEEAAEVNVKLATVLDAVLPGASVHLT